MIAAVRCLHTHEVVLTFDELEQPIELAAYGYPATSRPVRVFRLELRLPDGDPLPGPGTNVYARDAFYVNQDGRTSRQRAYVGFVPWELLPGPVQDRIRDEFHLARHTETAAR